MITVSGNLVAEFTTYISGSLAAFWPLLAAIIGMFAAFGISRRFMHMLRLK